MRLKIIALLLIGGGAAQAQITVTNVCEITTVSVTGHVDQVGRKLDYVQRLRSQPATEKYLGAALDMLVEAVVELNDKVNSATNHAPTVVTVTQECRHVEWAKRKLLTNDIIGGSSNLIPVTDDIIHVEARPLNPVKGQRYKIGKDPNTHTYLGGGCWSSTLLHWSESINVEAEK